MSVSPSRRTLLKGAIVLAPNPLADDGLGGMPAGAVIVEWEVADDERFTRVVQRGITTAAAELAHSVHVELIGLRPGAEHCYRFRTGGHISPAGRTRTAPEPGSLAPMTMCFASCSNYEQGWFTAYRRLADEHPDLVVHLGDYQYDYPAGKTTVAGGNVRDHVGPETVTLADYRQRYAQYKTDPDLQAAHAAAPWLAVFDDHELADNWADEVASEPQPAFLDRRTAALQAYYENMPLRGRRRRGASTCSCIDVCTGVTWRRSTCSTPGSTATTRPAATRSAATARNGSTRSAL